MSLRRVAITLGLVLIVARTAAAQVGFVNTDQILQQTPGYGTVDSTLSAEGAVYQQEAEGLQAQLDSASAAFDQQRLMLNPQAREERLNDAANPNSTIVSADPSLDLTSLVISRLQGSGR
jgi:Skp family chaperone for outer membrane proteins